MAKSFSTDNKEAENEQLLQLVGFTIGKQQFGVNILMAQEIIRAAPITIIPNSPDFVEGIINLRGKIIPVIELRKRLNLYTEKENMQEKDTWILILDIDGSITGFIVDSVTEVLKVLEKDISPAPELVVAGLESQYIRGVCDIDKQLTVLLDFNRILLVEELKQLKSMEVGQ